MAEKKSEQPRVTHMMAGGNIRRDIEGYAADFYQLPEAARGLLVRLVLEPIGGEGSKEDAEKEIPAGCAKKDFLPGG